MNSKLTRSNINYNSDGLSVDTLKELYFQIALPRLVEEKMLILLRQNKITKWFSGIGQEAISVAAAMAMKQEEFILPMHRNLGVFTARGVPLSRLFSQFQGKMKGFTKGRDRSFHFGTLEYNLVGMISHLGAQLSVADGIALAQKMKNKSMATLVFTGDGGASEGEFHEALNVAAVWDLPVIFVVENNGYGLSTPNSEQFRFKNFIDKGPGYGIESKLVDGNNVLEVYQTIKATAQDIRNNPRPVMIEALTFRMRGHEEASGTKYVPQSLMEHWAKKDPVENYENHLISEGVLTAKEITAYKNTVKKQINSALEEANLDHFPQADELAELNDVYAPHKAFDLIPQKNFKREMRYIDAISDALRQSMNKYDDLVLMGQDIADYGGVFKITEGFLQEFGNERVRNTPICESAIIGIGLGLSIMGQKSVIEMQFADFVSCGFNQIVNNLAKSHYRWGQNADVVIRMPTGAGVGAGPFHSQSNEAWFFHVPGLKIVYPSSPYMAKGLLNAAIADPNPILYFEHKKLYRSISQRVPEDFYALEIGKGRVKQKGGELTVITYGLGVHWASEVMDQFPDRSIEIIDLCSLIPWDKELVFESVKKCCKVLLLSEDTITGSIIAELSAWISENCFEYLDAPIKRVGSLDTPVPFNKELENNFLANARLKNAIHELLLY